MDLSTKDAVLLILGVVGGFIPNAVWSWWTARSRKSREAARAEEALWRARLNHEGYAVRTEAANEIIVRAIYWLVLGNVLFGVTGLLSALNILGIYELHLAVTELAFLLGLVFLAISLKWLRRYLRLKEPLFEAGAPNTTEPVANPDPTSRPKT